MGAPVMWPRLQCAKRLVHGATAGRGESTCEVVEAVRLLMVPAQVQRGLGEGVPVVAAIPRLDVPRLPAARCSEDTETPRRPLPMDSISVHGGSGCMYGWSR